MDMVAEAKKRQHWEYNDSGLGSITTSIMQSFSAVYEHNEFIANTPAFIVAQDERIKRLEKVVEATRQLLEKKFALDGGYYFMDGNGQEPQLHLMEVLKAYDLEENA